MTLYENGVVVAQTVTTVRPFGALDPTQQPGRRHRQLKLPGKLQRPLQRPDRRAVGLQPGPHAGRGLRHLQAPAAAARSSRRTTSPPTSRACSKGPAGTTTPVTFTIQRVGSLAGQAVVNWTTADDTATAGSDYVAASGQVIFQDGESQKTVQVTVNGDNTPEPNETFWLEPLHDHARLRGRRRAWRRSSDDDAAVSVSDATATEGDARLGSLGALVAAAGNGGLDRSTGMAFGPDGNLYVASLNTNEVLRYDATTGAFLGAVRDRRQRRPDRPGDGWAELPTRRQALRRRPRHQQRAPLRRHDGRVPRHVHPRGQRRAPEPEGHDLRPRRQSVSSAAAARTRCSATTAPRARSSACSSRPAAAA